MPRKQMMTFAGGGNSTNSSSDDDEETAPHITTQARHLVIQHRQYTDRGEYSLESNTSPSFDHQQQLPPSSPRALSIVPSPTLSPTLAPAAPTLDFDEDTGNYFKRPELEFTTTNTNNAPQSRLYRRETASIQFIDVPSTELLSDVAAQAAAQAATERLHDTHSEASCNYNSDEDSEYSQQVDWTKMNVCDRADHARLRCWGILKRDFVPESIWVILTLLGAGMSIVAWMVDEVIDYLNEIRNDIAQLPKLSISPEEDEEDVIGRFFAARSPATSAILYLIWMIFWGLCAVAVCKYLAPQAAGSGIEQVRSIMTGYSIPGFLSPNTLIAKIVGLICVQASGLKIGKEGPFVHIACSLANALLFLPWFKEIRNSRALSKSVISAACASGIASTFGSPVGGVLFAIEVTSNVLHTSDYWKAFYTAVLGNLFFRFLSYFGTAHASQISLFPTTFPAQPYSLSEIPSFVLLSMLGGFYGGYFVKIILGVRTWRLNANLEAVEYFAKGKKLPERLQRASAMDKALHDMWMYIAYYLLSPWMWAVTVLTLHWAFSFTTEQFMKRSMYASIEDFLVDGNMAQNDRFGTSAHHKLHSTDWGRPSVLITLFMYLSFNSFLFAIAMSLPVPSGTLISMMSIGLSFGRLYGEIFQALGSGNLVPGGYALVGASAYLAGATGAISTAVIVFEVTAQLTFMVPVLIAVIIGRACGKVISPDIYEALQIIKNLPNIPPLSRQSSYGILAKDLMDPHNIPLLPRYCSLARLEQLLYAPKSHRYEDGVSDTDLFAIVTNDHDRFYMVSVSRLQLTDALVAAQEASENMSEEERASILLDVFTALTDHTQMTPACPHNMPAIDILQLFELSLMPTMFVTENARVIGWLDLEKIKHKIEHQKL